MVGGGGGGGGEGAGGEGEGLGGEWEEDVGGEGLERGEDGAGGAEKVVEGLSVGGGRRFCVVWGGGTGVGGGEGGGARWRVGGAGRLLAGGRLRGGGGGGTAAGRGRGGGGGTGGGATDSSRRSRSRRRGEVWITALRSSGRSLARAKGKPSVGGFLRRGGVAGTGVVAPGVTRRRDGHQAGRGPPAIPGSPSRMRREKSGARSAACAASLIRDRWRRSSNGRLVSSLPSS